MIMDTPWFVYGPLAVACAAVAGVVAVLCLRWRAEGKRERQRERERVLEQPVPPRARPVPPGRLVAGRHGPRPRPGRNRGVMLLTAPGELRKWRGPSYNKPPCTATGSHCIPARDGVSWNDERRQQREARHVFSGMDLNQDAGTTPRRA